jgi:drug/metabolite transporter (DMT)-like permease
MSLRLKVYIGFIAACLIWGSSWAAVKLGIESIPPLLSLTLRFSIASLLLGIIVAVQKISVPKDKNFWKLVFIICGTLFTVPFVLIYWAQMRVDSGLASILFATFPLWVTLTSRYFLPNERITSLRLAGMILGFLGVVFIFINGIDIKNFGTQQTSGMIAIVAAAIIQATGLVALRKFGANANPISLNFWSMLLSALFLLPASLVIEDYSTVVLNIKSVGSLIYLSLFCTVFVFVIYFWITKHVEAVILSLSAFITPVIAVLVGVYFMREEFTGNMYIGSLLVLLGVGFATVGDFVARYNKRFMRI